MKYIILVGDGMGDYPVDALGGKTPLQAARAPHLRRLAAAGEVRMVQTIPDGLPPGSDVGNLDLMGYDPSKNYTGRAPIEAAGGGVPLQPDDVAFRCNLVTVKDGLMEDYSAGHITTEEAHPLIAHIEKNLGRPGLRFHGGVSYRHLLVWKNGPTDLKTTPPHDITGKRAVDHLPAGKRQNELRALIEKSKALLAAHPVNQARVKSGHNPATQIWLWGQGRALRLESFQHLYGLTGGVISAVDLVRGIGLLAGLAADPVPGATGFLDTNYAGKVEAALRILQTDDFVYVHIEAPDECGHLGDAARKVQAIEDFDQKVVGPIWRELERRGQPYRLLLAMDHRTPVSTRSHTREPVPMAWINGPVGAVSAERPFDEFHNQGRSQILAHEWVRQFLTTRS